MIAFLLEIILIKGSFSYTIGLL